MTETFNVAPEAIRECCQYFDIGEAKEMSPGKEWFWIDYDRKRVVMTFKAIVGGRATVGTYGKTSIPLQIEPDSEVDKTLARLDRYLTAALSKPKLELHFSPTVSASDEATKTLWINFPTANTQKRFRKDGSKKTTLAPDDSFGKGSEATVSLWLKGVFVDAGKAKLTTEMLQCVYTEKPQLVLAEAKIDIPELPTKRSRAVMEDTDSAPKTRAPRKKAKKAAALSSSDES